MEVNSKSREVPRPPVVDDTSDFTLFESHPITSEDLKPADNNLTFTDLTELIVGLLKDYGGSPELFQSHEGDQMAVISHGLDVETYATDVKEQDVDRQRGDKDF